MALVWLTGDSLLNAKSIVFTLLLALLPVNAAATSTYEYVTPAEELAAVSITQERSQDSNPVDGINLVWSAPHGSLYAILQNATTSTIEVLWDRSALVDPDGVAYGIMPGSARVGDARAAFLPTSVIPPGGRLEEFVLRRDDVHIGSVVPPIVSAAWANRVFSLTLSARVDGEVVFITHRFKVERDTATLDALEKGRALAAQQAVAHRYFQAGKWVGIGAVGGAALYGVSALGSNGDEDAAIMAGMAVTHLVVGLPVSYMLFAKARKVNKEMK